MLIIRIIYTYIKSYIGYIFIKNDESLYKLSGKSLLKNELRVGSVEKKDNLFGLKTLKRTLIRLSTNNILSQNNSSELIYDGGDQSFDWRKEFINYFIKNENSYQCFSLQNSIYKINLIDQIIQYCLFIFLNFITLPLSLFYKTKSKIVLQPVYILESIGLIRYCIKNKVEKVYYFCIYENNSNINALLLKMVNIECCKIPSEVPISYDNKIIIADELAICFSYQREEIKEFSNTIKVNKFLDWGPENIKKAVELFSEGQQLTIKNTKVIGYFSSGNKIRGIRGTPDLTFNADILEEQILLNLVDFVQNTDYQLLVCLHPIEKRSENLSLSKNYYHSIFKENCIIAPIDKSTYELHNDINIAIGLFSTILFERIYLGFKTIIMPIGLESFFPVKNSYIQNICVMDNTQLCSKLNDSLNLTPKLFFELNNIIDYSPFIKNKQLIF